MKRQAENKKELQQAAYYMIEQVSEYPAEIEIFEGVDLLRTKPQNSLIHKHLGEAAKHFGHTARYQKWEAKYCYGLPILAQRKGREGQQWADYLQRIDDLPYETRLALMDVINVTSEFTIPECIDFINAYTIEWTQQGCVLTDPSDWNPEVYAEMHRQWQAIQKEA